MNYTTFSGDESEENMTQPIPILKNPPGLTHQFDEAFLEKYKKARALEKKEKEFKRLVKAEEENELIISGMQKYIEYLQNVLTENEIEFD